MTALDHNYIQANLLVEYKHLVVTHLFAEVGPNDDGALRELVASLPELLTTFARFSQGLKATVNVGLSYRALSRLRPELAQEVREAFAVFSAGMPDRADALGDGKEFDRDAWRARDVWVSVHSRDPQDMANAVRELRSRLSRLRLTELRGDAIVKEDHFHEHFGFRDDISFPAFDGMPGLTPEQVAGRGKLIDGTWRSLAAGEFVLGQADELGRDALTRLSEDARRVFVNGSFGVFRQLQQHVDVFRRYVGADEERAEKMMGRRKNGAPLGRVAASAEGDSRHSAFDYANDPAGAQCPLGSHVRRMNPRGADGRHRLIRRSTPFGKPLAEGERETEPLGLLFVAFNADLADQFEFVQKVWCNGTLANNVPNSRDPIGSAIPERSMMIEGDVAASRAPRPLLDIPSLVTCLGGQYYFYPGRSGLAALAASTPGPASSRRRARS